MRKLTKLMQLLIVVVLSTFVFALQGTAQTTLLTESFESAAVGQTPPTGWAVDLVGTTTNWTYFQSAGTWPTCTPNDGTRMVEFQSFNASSGYANRLKRTTALSTVGFNNVSVDFMWLQDPGYASNADRVEVQWSTNGTSWTTAGTAINRYAATQAWSMQTVTLPSGAAGQATLYVAFLFTSAYGNNCHLDLMHVKAVGPPPPATVTVGTGTLTTGYPYYTFYMGARTQMLYTKAEIQAAGGSPGQITSIGFNVNSVQTQIMQGFTIKMRATSATTIGAWVTDSMTVVYNTNYGVTATGWQMITLTTPFVYSGRNLLVEVCFGNNGSYTTNSLVYGTTMPGKVFGHYQDNDNGCLNSASYTTDTRPNLRFVELPYVGMLTGIVTNCYTGAPMAGAMVQILGTTIPAATTSASGAFTFYNVPIGTYTLQCTMSGFVLQTQTITITNGNTTTANFCMDPIPAILTGIVTNAATGAPVVGAKVRGVSGSVTVTTYSTGPTGAYSLKVFPGGSYTVTVSKPGFDDLPIGTFTLTPPNTTTQNAALLEKTNAPLNLLAALNTGQTAVNLTWGLPQGDYLSIYDDGIPEGFAIWEIEGNLDATKFTPVGYPAVVKGCMINIGKNTDYTGGGHPVSFKVGIFDATGTGGTPGTQIGSYYDFTVPANTYGWIEAPTVFGTGVTINSGSFYIVTKQVGAYPNAAGIAIDTTTQQMRSYQRFITGGAPWVPASGNFLIRAFMYGSGGPLLTDSPETLVNYQVYRLLQGQENTPGSWIPIGTPSAPSFTDNGWPSLPCNQYMWAVKAQYTNNRWSNAVTSNAIGKCWTATVIVNVDISCAANPPANCEVILERYKPGTTPPPAVFDSAYHVFTPASGIDTIHNVYKGTYRLTVKHFGYTDYVQDNISLMGDMTFDVFLLQIKTPPTGLAVNDRNLLATWNPPHLAVPFFTEDFSSGSFTTNGWVESPSNSNWQVSTATGNPAPSAFFNWTPEVTGYDHYLTSKAFAGLHSPVMKLNFDLFLDNYGNTNLNTLAVELWDGTTWHVLQTWDNSTGANIPWTSIHLDVSQYTDLATFKIRFHAAGVDSIDIDGWYVDNVSLTAEDVATNNPCVLGYNFYLNNALSGFTPDTFYHIPSDQVVYGQTYNACVLAIWGSGYSAKNCVTFTSHFLCPVTNLQVDSVDNAAYLTWEKPQCTAGELMTFIYDDGVGESGWRINPGYTDWLGNKFPILATQQGVLKSFDVLWFNYGTGTTAQNFTIDVFSMAGALLGSSPAFNVPAVAPTTFMNVLVNDIPFNGPFYAMLKWNNFTGATPYLGFDTNGPFAAQNLGYYYDGTAFSPIQVVGGGSPGVFTVRATAFVYGDKKDVVLGPETTPPAAPKAVDPASLSHADGIVDSHDYRTSGVIGTSAPDAGTGLVGYNVYKNEVFLKYVPGPDSLSTYDMLLDPGTYCYDVTAKYDLTAFNLPPGFDESLPEDPGPICTTIHYGHLLPFEEPWTSGNFGFNGWANGPNWSVNTGSGNPAPSADFSWQPIVTGYDQSLESGNMDASLIYCAKVWMDFDYKLADRNNTGNEKLAIDVKYNNVWHQKAEFSNSGSVNWTPQHIDISAVKGKGFKVRFRAHGPNSADILHWYVDNIKLYGICNPAQNFAVDQGVSTTCPFGAHLTWSPPHCVDAPTGNPLNEGFEGATFPPQFFTQVQTNATYTWLHSDAAAIWGVHTGNGSAGVNWDYDHQDEWLIAHNIAITGNLTFWSYAYQGSTYLDHYYVKVSPDAGTTWVVVFDLSALPPYPDWNSWLTPYVVDLGAYLGTNLDIAWQAVDGDGAGLWYVWGIDDLTVGADKLDVSGLQHISAGTVNPYASKTCGIDPTTHAKIAAKGILPTTGTLTDNTDAVNGYDVYRMGPNDADFVKINGTTPVADTSYCDVTYTTGWNTYYVQAVYAPENCSYAERTDTIGKYLYTLSVPEITNGSVTVFPNPANEVVNVKSDYNINTIEVVNFIGQTIYRSEEGQTKLAKINTASLMSGIYIVKVTTTKGSTMTKITVTH